MTHRLEAALTSYRELKEQIPPATAAALEVAEAEIRAACEEVGIKWPTEIGALVIRAAGWLKQKGASAAPPAPGV